MRRALFVLLFLLLADSTFGQITNVTVGTANAGSGDSLYTAFGKINYALRYFLTNSTSLSVASAGDGITDDTLAVATAVTNANALGFDLDLAGGVYSITNLSITFPITIKNGTLKARTTYTNSSGFISVTSPNVRLEHVNIDGASNALRALRVNYPSTGFSWVGGAISNLYQPSGLDAQTAAVVLTDGTESHFYGGWLITNVVATTNGITGDDQGCARGFYIVRVGTNAPAQFTLEDGEIASVRPPEDADGIAVHNFGAGTLVPGTIRNVYFNDVYKRWVKLMGEGVTVESCKGANSSDGTNRTQMNAYMSVYASHSKILNNEFPVGATSYEIDASCNGNPIYDLTIIGNSLVGTNGFLTATTEGLRIGGAEGVVGAVVAGNRLSLPWAKPLIAYHIAGGVTNLNFTGNFGEGLEGGLLDGYRYSGETNWTTNQFGNYTGNTFGGPSYAARYRKTANLGLSGNSITSGSETFDNGYAATVITRDIWGARLQGGSVTNALAVHIGDSASTTWNSEVPDIQVATSQGTNAIVLVRFYDVLGLNRMLAIRASTNGISLDASQTTGGNGTFTIRMSGSSAVTTWDSSGYLHLGDSSAPAAASGSGVPSLTLPNGSLYTRTDGTGPNLYVRENGAWVSK